MSEASNVPVTPQGESLARIPFGPVEEASIRSLSTWMTMAGAIYLFAGLAHLVQFFMVLRVGLIVNAVIEILVGAWCIQASSAFRKVATTDVADQSYLMVAFRKLRSLFLLQAIIVILGLVLVCAAFLVILLISLAHHRG